MEQQEQSDSHSRPQAISEGPDWIRATLFTVAAVFILMAVCYGGMNWFGERSWRRQQAQSATHGYFARPIPDQDNFAKTPLLVRFGYRNATNRAAVPSPNINWNAAGSF